MLLTVPPLTKLIMKLPKPAEVGYKLEGALYNHSNAQTFCEQIEGCAIHTPDQFSAGLKDKY